MNPIYRYFLFLNENEAGKVPAFPNYKDDVSVDLEMESNQKFYRKKLNGKISFIRNDFNYIIAQNFDTDYKFEIEISFDFGLTWNREYLGKFNITDCEIDYDDLILSVQIDNIDDYTDVLNGLEKEYNLIQLLPEIEQLTISKRPLIQVYIPGQNIVSCFLSGETWEQDCETVTNKADLVNDYKFALSNMLKEMNLTSNGGLAVDGLYTGRMSLSGSNFTGTLISNTNLLFRIEISVAYAGVWFGLVEVDIIRNSDNLLVYRYTDGLSSGESFDNEDFTMTPRNGSPGDVTNEMATYNIYSRYLLDKTTIGGLTTYPLPTNDIVPYNRNYSRVIGYAFDVSYLSINYSLSPTEWGRNDIGQYYLPPYSIFGDKFYPIARSSWRYSSIWFKFDSLDFLVERDARKEYVMRDTFPIYTVISSLLAQFAPDITHDKSPEYSEFLYSETNPITGIKFFLMMTQKTNVLFGNYQQPAQKAQITLKWVTNMLRDCFRCFWHIEDGKFRIEHVSWYQNGGSYSSGGVVGTDLTQLINVRNGKNWAFNTSKVTFDKVDMPERYEFTWMDDVTETFEGMPIEVLSKYVQKGKIEEIGVMGFNSDIDFMLLNPEDMNKDGFALFAAVNPTALVDDPIYFGLPTSGTGGQTTPKYKVNTLYNGKSAILNLNILTLAGNYQVLFYDISGAVIWSGSLITATGMQSVNVDIPLDAYEIGLSGSGVVDAILYSLIVPTAYALPFVLKQNNGVDFYSQNGLLAFEYLQPNFYVYDLPARDVLINGENIEVYGVERKKKQTLNFPVGSNIDPLELITTNIGNGQVDKISINLSSRMAKTTLKYDTEPE